MGVYIEQLKKALDEFEQVKGDIDAIHQCKNEIQSLKEQLCDSVRGGYFLRDEARIILSAPEIVLGNVDHSGMMVSDGGSVVTVRGNDVKIHGASDSGSVEVKAPVIRNIAVNPGRDGMESSVASIGSIIENKAVSISLTSNAILDAISDSDSPASGISISSDTGISLSAAPSNKSLKDEICKMEKNMDEFEKSISESLSRYKSSLDETIKEMTSLAEKYEGYTDSEFTWRGSDSDIVGMRETFRTAEFRLTSIISDYMKLLSLKAENNRRKDAVKNIKGKLDKESSEFTKKPTGASISVTSEIVSLQSMDGDGNIRTNPDAGLFINSPRVKVKSTDKKGSLIKDGSVVMNVENFLLSTADVKLDDKKESGDIPAVGNVSVISKNISFAALDSELKDKKVKEKSLTKEGVFSIRAESILASATDTEGKSTGNINLNAKNIRLASMDVDKEKRTDKEMAAGSSMVLLSEKIFTGATDKKNKSKLVQVVSDKIGIMADTTAEMQQGESKAVVTLDGGNLAAGGGKNEFSGDTTINGKADVKGDVTAPKGEFKNLEAGSSFKSPNISDGMGVGAGGAAGKPSAKMKMEEVQNQEKK